MKTFRGTKRISIAAGEPFRIALPVNATAGYEWQVETLPAAVTHLTPDEFDAQPAVGAASEQCLTFRADREGSYPIRTILKRSWEAQPAGVQEFVFEVSP